ncbi:MAG: SCO family protein [Bacteroidetes bacterium]|nr:SCO family protein [Bacteroidota bacterium]
MKKSYKYILLGIILIAPVVWGLIWKYSKTSYKKLPVFGDIEMTGDTTPWVIPDFSFTNQNNQTVTQNDFKGKIYVANFFFTSCAEVCPRMNRNLFTIYEKYKSNQDLKFISHTVDPEFDSVEVLKQYAKKMHVDNNKWYFVTGNKNQLYTLAIESYKAVAVSQNDDRDFIHSDKLVLVDKEKHIRGFYDSQDYKEILRLEDDLKILFKEYSEKL